MAPHNIWLSCPPRANTGEEVNCFIYFGHNFEVEGKADPSRTRAWLLTPEGRKKHLLLTEQKTKLTATFTPTTPGVYTILAEYDGKIWSIATNGRHLRGPRSAHPEAQIQKSVYYYQSAKTFINVDTGSPWPEPLGTELEIYPQRNADGGLAVTVYYEGKPLAGAGVHAFKQGVDQPRIAKTDSGGMGYFTLTPGDWMILVSHYDPSKGMAGLYDEHGLTAVFNLKQS